MKKILSTALIGISLVFLSAPAQVMAEITHHNSQALTEDEATTLGKKFAKAANSRNVNAVNGLMDYEIFSTKTAKTITENTEEIKGFKEGFLRGMKRKKLSIMSGLMATPGVTARYIRNIKGTRPLIRLDFPDGGSGYFYLMTSRSQNGTIKVTDIYDMNANTTMSSKVGAFSKLFTAPNKPLIQKLFGINQVDKKLTERFEKLSHYRQTGQNKKAIEVINSLPEEIKNSVLLLETKAQLTPIDSPNYESIYKKYIKKIGNKTTSIVFVDYYFLAKEYDKVLLLTKDIETELEGSDGTTLLIRAAAHFEKKEYEKAISASNQAIEINDFSEEILWTKFNSHLELEQHGKAATTLTELEQKYQYYFQPKDFEVKDESMRKFILSEEFKNFFANR